MIVYILYVSEADYPNKALPLNHVKTNRTFVATKHDQLVGIMEVNIFNKII